MPRFRPLLQVVIVVVFLILTGASTVALNTSSLATPRHPGGPNKHGINSITRSGMVRPHKVLGIENATAEAQSSNVELVGHIGGSVHAVTVRDNYAYLGVDRFLEILDVSNLTNPTVVGRTGIMPDNVNDVAIVSNYAYVAASRSWNGSQYVGGGLRIINISDPTAPSEVGYYHMPDTLEIPSSVTVVGSYAYVAADSSWNGSQYAGGGLHIINIANPTAPIQVSFYDMPSGARDVVVAGNYAFVAGWNPGLRVINVSNPDAPTEVGSYNTPGIGVGTVSLGELHLHY